MKISLIASELVGIISLGVNSCVIVMTKYNLGRTKHNSCRIDSSQKDSLEFCHY